MICKKKEVLPLDLSSAEDQKMLLLLKYKIEDLKRKDE